MRKSSPAPLWVFFVEVIVHLGGNYSIYIYFLLLVQKRY